MLIYTRLIILRSEKLSAARSLKPQARVITYQLRGGVGVHYANMHLTESLCNRMNR